MSGKPPLKRTAQDGQLSETREAMKSNFVSYSITQKVVVFHTISCKRDLSPTQHWVGRQFVEDLCSTV